MTAYFLKTILCSGLLLLFYLLFLEREKMHRFNRFYLLAGLVFCFIVPLITIPVAATDNPVVETFSRPQSFLSEQTSTPTEDGTPQAIVIEQTTPLWPKLLLVCYLTVTLILLYRFIKNIATLLSGINKTKAISYKGAKLILTEKPLLPYSFLQYIFINKEAFGSGHPEHQMLQHELTHVQQQHSLDILFIELLTVFAWANPFLFLYRKAMALNHEFLADEGVIQQAADVRSYQLLLLQKAGGKQLSLTSSFNYSITKKRLVMMTRKTSGTMAGLKLIMLLPLLLAAILFFSKRVSGQQKTIAPGKPERKSEAIASEQKEKQITRDTTRPYVFTRLYIGSTEKGASQEELDEYKDILDKYGLGKGKPWEGIKDVMPADRTRLEDIFKQMTRLQQANQSIVFMKPVGPLAKSVPTKAQFEAFKNPKVYGVWMDDKKISNSVLNNYRNTDISYVFISKLYRAAKAGKSYTHQVDLMTNEYFKKDCIQRSRDITPRMVYTSHN